MIKTFQQTLNSKLVARPLQLASLALIIMNLSGECLGICNVTTNSGTYKLEDAFCDDHIQPSFHSSKAEDVMRPNKRTVIVGGTSYNYDFTPTAK